MQVFILRFCVRGFLCNIGYVLTRMDGNKLSPIEDLLPVIKNLYQIEWFKNQSATWNKDYEPVFTEVFSKSGYGFSFNQLPKTKLFTKE